MAVDVIKRHYLNEHILVRARNMDLNDRALDDYLVNLLKQGNTLCAKTVDGAVAGVCVNFASSPVDPGNLRLYAYYRQIKMLTVLPEFRRQGLAVLLAEKSKEQAMDQGYKVIRMDCINAYDYKVAERCMLQCIVKYPLHKLRGPNAPYIKRNSAFNRYVRVYVDARTQNDVPDKHFIRQRQIDIDSLIE
ncbi:unnamed protein product [Diatraea saccharalis]|uniref:N-acetyltransferase domain-containing protein n=1 Tax=Diatraea saccharalis TaxID=40085 RepID=A0A9N9WK10_9NEOP|nr:unnamed protein product [Diatraea saccharalis]